MKVHIHWRDEPCPTTCEAYRISGRGVMFRFAKRWRRVRLGKDGTHSALIDGYAERITIEETDK